MANLLPPNATELERNVANVNAVIADLPAPLRDLVNPDTCPARLLPWLASTLSVDAWNDAWTDAQKRAVIKASFLVHQRKGTVAAVRAALGAIDLGVTLTEWWQETPPATPHTFRLDVEITTKGITEQEIDFLDGQVNSVKPVRSHFTTRLNAHTTLQFGIACLAYSGETTKILPFNVRQIDAELVASVTAVGFQDWMTTTIYPSTVDIIEAQPIQNVHALAWQDWMTTTISPKVEQ